MWEVISGILKDPDQLRADLDAMIELERRDARQDPDNEVKLWADKLAEVEQMRRGYQEQSARGYMSLDELGAALEELEKSRATAQRELEMLHNRKEHLERLERDRDELLDSLANMAPDALDALTPEERHQLYKMIRLKVTASQDESLELRGALGDDFSVCNSEHASRCCRAKSTKTP